MFVMRIDALHREIEEHPSVYERIYITLPRSRNAAQKKDVARVTGQATPHQIWIMQILSGLLDVHTGGRPPDGRPPDGRPPNTMRFYVRSNLFDQWSLAE